MSCQIVRTTLKLTCHYQFLSDITLVNYESCNLIFITYFPLYFRYVAFLCDTSIPSELNGYEQLRKRQLELHFFFISVVKLIMTCFSTMPKKNYQLKKKRQQRVDNELCFDHIQKEFKLSFQKKVGAPCDKTSNNT